ncbi:hypothetical protein [Nesterenkonia alba]|uniref:hypothetical protein n=1 Tax=Nesterenkonia alba TaxID=515814 RepID=UPI0003B49289|nr:hypothetical protein [Nesterenkonia alba]
MKYRASIGNDWYQLISPQYEALEDSRHWLTEQTAAYPKFPWSKIEQQEAGEKTWTTLEELTTA